MSVVCAKLQAKYNEVFSKIVEMMKNGEFEEAKIYSVLASDIRKTMRRFGCIEQ